ncbi:hypothetical protein [Leifsonia sp. NPDC080035]|uniref:Uncharacterized protein n=1 Tax=Leifsonia sp. NPDC080035 TaxID=3143936 RepID=A0AAU7GDL6_9MICO
MNTEVPQGSNGVRRSRWQTPSGEWREAVRYYEPEPSIDNIDLSLFYTATKGRKLRPLQQKPTAKGRARVYLFTDPQIGKVDSRRGVQSGTPEFIERMNRIRAEVTRDLKLRPVQRAVVADGGDGIESVNQQTSQLFTSDVSEPEAVNIYAAVLHELITTVHRGVQELDVMVTPSNHSRWRRGKEQLGRVGDDWGLTVHQLVERTTKAGGLQISYHSPASMWDDIASLDLWGHEIALHHGDQSRPGSQGMASWLAKKTASGELVNTELLLTGHYHHLLFTSLGTTASGVPRTWLQGMALDAGSNWFARAGGFDSPAGMVSVDVTEHGGVDLGSLRVFDGSTVEEAETVA